MSQLLGNEGQTSVPYGYDPYGEEDTTLTKGDPATNDVNITNPFRYSAKRYDTGSQTIDMGARRFSPDTSRFLQADLYRGALSDLSLSTDPLTQNRYALAGGNPVSFVELDGHVVGINGYGSAKTAVINERAKNRRDRDARQTEEKLGADFMARQSDPESSPRVELIKDRAVVVPTRSELLEVARDTVDADEEEPEETDSSWRNYVFPLGVGGLIELESPRGLGTGRPAEITGDRVSVVDRWAESASAGNETEECAPHVTCVLNAPEIVPPGRGAITLGHYVFWEGQIDQGVLQHELVHVEQWERFDIAMLPLYASSMQRCILRDQYVCNEFERDATERSGY